MSVLVQFLHLADYKIVKSFLREEFNVDLTSNSSCDITVTRCEVDFRFQKIDEPHFDSKAIVLMTIDSHVTFHQFAHMFFEKNNPKVVLSGDYECACEGWCDTIELLSQLDNVLVRNVQASSLRDFAMKNKLLLKRIRYDAPIIWQRQKLRFEFESLKRELISLEVYPEERHVGFMLPFEEHTLDIRVPFQNIPYVFKMDIETTDETSWMVTIIKPHNEFCCITCNKNAEVKTQKMDIHWMKCEMLNEILKNQ